MLKEFRENFVGVLTLVIVALTIYGLLKLNSSTVTAQSTNPTPAPADRPRDVDNVLHAAVYTTTEGQSSALGLNNALDRPLSARVTLYNKHGQALAIAPITLGPHQNHAWNIADWVRDVDGFEEGSLEVFYHGPSMALGAQETVTDVNHSLSYDVHLQEDMDFMSPRADGMWWALDNNTDAGHRLLWRRAPAKRDLNSLFHDNTSGFGCSQRDQRSVRYGIRDVGRRRWLG